MGGVATAVGPAAADGMAADDGWKPSLLLLGARPSISYSGLLELVLLEVDREGSSCVLSIGVLSSPEYPEVLF